MSLDADPPGASTELPGDSAESAGGPGDSAGVPGDSAGVPWAGRTLTGQPFAGDDGTTDPELLAALAGWRATHNRAHGEQAHGEQAHGERVPAGRPAGDRDGDRVALMNVVRAWAPTRVLVPIVAVLGEGEDLRSAAEQGQGDKSADMALVTITGPDGRKILPTFTSTAALATWNATARPVPVEAARAAQAAVLEECDLIAIDPAGPVDCLLPRPVVWAVAQGRDWLPPAEDPEVLTAVAAIAAAVPGLAAHRCEPDGLAGVNIVLGLPPGLTSDQVHQIAAHMSQRLSTADLITERATTLRLTVRPT